LGKVSRPLDRLRRVVSPGRRFIPEVDGLRFVAVAGIVVYHVAEMLRESGLATAAPPRLLHYVTLTGYYSVDLFFGISGFVLALPFARQHLAGRPPVSLRAYYMRRLTRLEPPYLIALFSDYFIRAAATGFGPWRDTLVSALYQHNIIYGIWSPVFGISWSLEIEVQFYMLAPLLSHIFLIRNMLLRRAVLLAAIVAGATLSGGFRLDRIYLSLLGHLHEFLVGFFLADLYVASWNESPKPGLLWDVVSLAAWPTLAALVLKRGNGSPLVPLAMLAAYGAAFRGRLSRRVFSAPVITTIGGMCYSIYLLHVSIIEAVLRLCEPLRHPASFTRMFALQACVLIPCILFVAVIFFLLMERPCMNPRWPADLRRWIDARLRRSAPTAGVEQG
jgi:peptidoglycan/LPS O-acetylase OafA/YrhL